MKSHIDTVLTIYDTLRNEASVVWPELARSFELDNIYLHRAAKERGLRFFTITLPALGKALDRALDQGTLDSIDIPQGIPADHGRAKLFGGLLSRVFDKSNKLLPSPDYQAIIFLRQFLYCFKKYRVDFTDDQLFETVSKFIETDSSLPCPWPLTFTSDSPIWTRVPGHPLHGRTRDEHACLDHRWQVLSFCADYLLGELGVPDYWSLTGRHGPGVVAEGSRERNKYNFPTWTRKLQRIFPFEWFGNGIIDTDHSYLEEEIPSRLIAVPKTQKSPRLICAEPICNQWIQQALWAWMADRITYTTLGKMIHFGSQECSQNRALYASIDGGLTTVDLSEASDRVSCRLVHYIFSKEYELLDYMYACRTTTVSQNIVKDLSERIVLNKFSTMGSALTFPVESIVFAVICCASYLLANELPLSGSSIRKAAEMITVFGDDLIVPTPCLSHLSDMLTECGLKINIDKTFSGSNFRESCGVDAFKGVDVTPAYILQSYDGTATSLATVVETSNNFFKKGYWLLSATIVNQIPPQERKLLRVVSGEVCGFGLFSYCGDSVDHLHSGYDTSLQREYSIALDLRNNSKKVRGRNTADLTQYFIEDPSTQDPLYRAPWSAGQISKNVIIKKRSRVPA